MATLSDVSIIEALMKKELIITPLEGRQIQAASVDLKLGKGFLRVSPYQIVEANSKVEYEKTKNDGFHVLKPNDFVLGTTKEWLEIPNTLEGQVCGKSTWARKGLIVEMAGFIDPGFPGNITLEIKNIGPAPILIRSNDLICQIKFSKLTKKCSVGYNNKYVGQKGVTGARREKGNGQSNKM